MIAVEKCELADKLMNFIFDDGQFSDDAHRAFGKIHSDRRIFQLSVDLFHFLRLFKEMVCIAVGQISAVQIDLVRRCNISRSKADLQKIGAFNRFFPNSSADLLC